MTKKGLLLAAGVAALLLAGGAPPAAARPHAYEADEPLLVTMRPVPNPETRPKRVVVRERRPVRRHPVRKAAPPPVVARAAPVAPVAVAVAPIAAPPIALAAPPPALAPAASPRSPARAPRDVFTIGASAQPAIGGGSRRIKLGLVLATLAVALSVVVLRQGADPR